MRETVSDVQAHGNRARMGMADASCKPPHRAREEEKKNYKGEERGELEERGAGGDWRARSEDERGLATQRHNGTGDGGLRLSNWLMCIGKVQTQ